MEWQTDYGAYTGPNRQKNSFSRRGIKVYGTLVGLALSGMGTFYVSDLMYEKYQKPPESTDLDCNPRGTQQVTYDYGSNDIYYLIDKITTANQDGPRHSDPCFDEAFEIAIKVADQKDYGIGTVVIPQYLVAEGMSLRDLKELTRPMSEVSPLP